MSLRMESTTENPADILQRRKQLEKSIIATSIGAILPIQAYAKQQAAEQAMKDLAQTTKSAVTNVAQGFDEQLKGSWAKKAKSEFKKSGKELDKI